FLRHVADMAADRRRLPNDVEAEAGSVSTVGSKQAAQHADGGGLAAAIGAKKSADFSCSDLQAQAVDDLQCAEALSQVVDVDDIVGHCESHTRFPFPASGASGGGGPNPAPINLAPTGTSRATTNAKWFKHDRTRFTGRSARSEAT